MEQFTTERASAGAHNEVPAECDIELGPPVVAHVTYKRKVVPTTGIDLVHQAVWDIAGVKATTNGLEIAPTGLAIVNKRNNNQYVSNPPFNFQSMLEVSGDFSLAIRLQSDTPLRIQLYGRPPVRFDDFNYYTSSIEFTTQNNTLLISVWDGTSQTPTPYEFTFSGVPTDFMLEVQRQGSDLMLIMNGIKAGDIPKGQIFDTGEVWLGVNSTQGDGLVSEFTAKPLTGATMALVDRKSVDIVEQSPPGLQTMVKKSNFLIGSAVSLNQLMFDPQYQQLVLGGNLGRFTTENELKPQDVHPEEELFTFERAGAMLDVANKFGLKVRGHVLVYTKANPEWMSNLPLNTDADKQHAREVFENHVRTVASFLNGKVDIIDVVNEVISGNIDIIDQPKVDPTSMWYIAYGGEQYIDRAFEIAHACAPNAKLYLNEVGIGNLYDVLGRADALLGLLERLKKDRKVPIDGVGIQGHVFDQLNIPGLPSSISIRDAIPYDHLLHRMQQITALGLDVQITEADVPGRSGTPQDICDQAKQFADIARACLDAQRCTGFTMWGITDLYGSRGGVDDKGQFVAAPDLIYDAQYRPKEAKRRIDTVLEA